MGPEQVRAAAMYANGKEGTLSEIAFALQMGKPIFGIDTWDIAGITKVESAQEAITQIKERKFKAKS